MKILFLLSLFAVLVLINSATLKAIDMHNAKKNSSKCTIPLMKITLPVGQKMSLPNSCGLIRCLKGGIIQYEICEKPSSRNDLPFPACCED